MSGSDLQADIVSVALDIAQRLDGIGIPHLVSGSFASSMYGEPRSTLDIDMVIDLRVTEMVNFISSVQASYYLDSAQVEEAVRSSGSFNAIHFKTSVKVDFFVAGQDPFEAERLKCSRSVRVGPLESDQLRVDTPEHTLLRKLEWFRRGGESSTRQWRDVLSIVALQGDSLDRDRLYKWSGSLGVTDLLDRALNPG